MLEGNNIRIANVSELGDAVKLVMAKSGEKSIGFRVGDKVASLDFTALNGQKITSDFSFEPFILLEFWGTWCKPCIEGIPALKVLYRKNKERVSLISVAYDKDIDKVRNFVKNNDLDGLHTFAQQGQKDEDSLIEKLQIDAYPTFILLDKNFTILARGTSEKALKEIENIINRSK